MTLGNGYTGSELYPKGTHVEPESLVRIAPGALVVGRPLPWTVYDADGKVLLRQGYVIHSESQLEQLFQRGRFRPRRIPRSQDARADDTRDCNPFAEYAGFLHSLEGVLTALTERQASAEPRLLGLARRLEQVCQQSPDASLALVHLYAVAPTIQEQILFHAILCQRVGQTLALAPARRLELVAAALAANLALVPVADQLNASSRVLSEPQRQVIRKHPERAVQALQAAGLDRPTLTRIIAQHHERFDGDGYPLGLTGDELLPEAETLALAERYVAMVTRRAYRERLSIHAARQAITGLAGRASRPAVARALLDVLGEYPPGVLVRLASREIGVVTRQQGQPRSPVVMAIVNAEGQRYGGCFERDTRQPEFRILGQEEPEQLPSMDFSRLWGLRT